MLTSCPHLASSSASSSLDHTLSSWSSCAHAAASALYSNTDQSDDDLMIGYNEQNCKWLLLFCSRLNNPAIYVLVW